MPSPLSTNTPPQTPTNTITAKPIVARLGWAEQTVLTQPPTHTPHQLAANAGSVAIATVETTKLPPALVPTTPANARRPRHTRVILAPWIQCTACTNCRAGLAGQCQAPKILGSPQAPGALAGTIDLPPHAITPIPHNATIDDEAATFAPILGDIAHMLQQVAIAARNYVTVVGDEPLALLAARLLTDHNTTVRLIGNDPQRLAIADQWQIKHRNAADIGMRNDQDLVILTKPDQHALELAIGMIRPRGELLLKCRPSINPTTWPAQLLNRLIQMEIRIATSWLGSPRVGLATLTAPNTTLDVTPLIQRRIDRATALTTLANAAQRHRDNHPNAQTDIAAIEGLIVPLTR